MAVLFNAGDQLPVIPLVEDVGKAASVVPEQIAATELNAGTISGSTVIINVVVTAHCPVSGVKV